MPSPPKKTHCKKGQKTADKLGIICNIYQRQKGNTFLTYKELF